MKTKIHLHKYKNFKLEAGRGKYPPSRIENYFLACFHLIEAFAFLKSQIHIQKHQKVRGVLERNEEVFGKDTEKVWKLFEELENKVRIATSYGGKEDGEKIKRAKEILGEIEKICGDLFAKRV